MSCALCSILLSRFGRPMCEQETSSCATIGVGIIRRRRRVLSVRFWAKFMSRVHALAPLADSKASFEIDVGVRIDAVAQEDAKLETSENSWANRQQAGKQDDRADRPVEVGQAKSILRKLPLLPP